MLSAPAPGPLIETFDVIGGRLEVRVIVPVTLGSKRIVFVPPMAFDWLIASRSVPGMGSSFVVVTTKSAADARVEPAARRLIARNERIERCHDRGSFSIAVTVCLVN